MSDEGEDSPPRPKRKIKKVMVLPSESDSDSDDSVIAAGTRRKRLKVVSDAESVSSSGSSVVAGTRRSRKLPRVPDSEADSDSSGWATEVETCTLAQPSKPTSGFASDSSEGNSDKCSICLMRFTTQEVGTPQNCEHIFCLDCITEWSKNVNTCPVDRMTFDVIVVRACAGGRVLRTEPVKVEVRRPSVDILVVEDPTVCEICGSTENEETMLLCDGCDLGYHMHCLTPPLSQVPIERWFCPNCDDLLDAIHLSDVEDLLSDMADMEMPMGPRPSALRQPRNVRRSARHLNTEGEPSTSSGQRDSSININEPTTSRGVGSNISSRTSSRGTNSRRKAITTRHTRSKYKRKRNKTVIIEYELEENGKVPVRKTVKRKIKKRTVKRRQPRTAARRALVRNSVRTRLAAQRGAREAACNSPQQLAARRHTAGIPTLSIFGNANQLDYFSEDEHESFEGSFDTALAVRPGCNVFSAHRQARRKMVSIPSPTPASSAPDILSSILESQTLLHSKKSVVTITVDGNVNIKLESKERESKKKRSDPKGDDRLDLSKGEEASKKVPSYPGQSRGGGWGGGYRGNYHREQTGNNFGRGNFGNESNYGGSYQNRQGQSYMPNDNMRRDDGENAHLADYTRRPNRYPPNNESPFDRNRRQSEQNRANLNLPSNTSVNEPSRYSMGSSWPPYGSRPDPPQHRHSFGGFENPLDMRMGPAPHNVADRNFNTLNAQRTRDEKPQLQGYRPLPEPPTFKFDKLPDVEKSEDEKSDSGLVIDTEKYDPMEPTHDDDSGDDEDQGPEAALSEPTAVGPQTSPPLAIAPLPSPPAPPCLGPVDPVHSILAEMDTSAINVPHNVLDSAVRQVLKEHRDLIAPPNIQSHNDRSDNESDGDCPNFSIYSATSVHIANNTSGMNIQTPKAVRRDSMEDLVQEDDDSTPPASSPAPFVAAADAATTTTTDTEAAPEKLPKNDSNKHSMETSSIKKRSEEEYKEKISKRCPITTNTRNPIKIKLNTPSLIKRQVTLYDEEDDADIENEEVESTTKTDDATIKQGNDTRSKREASPPPNLNKAQSEESNQVDQEESSEKDKDTKDSIDKHSPKADSNQVLPELDDGIKEEDIFEDKSANTNTETMTQVSSDLEHKETSDNHPQTEDENDDTSEIEDENLQVPSQSPKQCSGDHNEEGLEKFTESISETEDERSYTPCLDENKSKDTSMETEREKGIEGLDTEMISEDEGNEMFSDHEKPPSDHERPPSVRSKASPECAPPVAIGDGEEGEILDKKKNKPEEGKKKKKKDSKKEGKDKGKKKKGDVGFKKISRSGKERNYRERDKEEKSKKREKRGASEGGERERQKQKRKEKRKDLERYDVRTIVSEKRRKPKDPFGRDISPRVRSRSPSLSRSPLPKRSLSRPRRSLSRERRSGSRGRISALRLRRSPSRGRRSPSAPPRVRRSPSRGRRSPSPVGRMRRTPSRGRSPIFRGRRSLSRPHLSPFRVRRSMSPVARADRASSSPPARRARLSPSPRSPSPRATSLRRSSSPRRKRRRSPSRGKRAEARRRGSTLRARRRRRSASGSRSPKPKPKKKKRARSERPASRRRSPRKKSPKRRRAKRRSVTPELTPVRAAPPPPEPERTPVAWSSPSVDSRLLSPRTPPPEEMRRERRRRDPERMRHRRLRDSVGPSKEVFTSGDNILVSVSFKDQERLEGEERRERRREKRRRKRRGPTIEAEGAAAKPVAIIDLERSPFRELTPSPKNVIVLSDSEPGEREEAQSATAEAAPGPQAPSEGAGASTAAAPPPSAPSGTAADEPRGPNTPPEPPDSPDAYDPYEPTRSASASPTEARAPSPARPLMTLEAAQKTNMSADEVIDRRPLSPIEKVMALLQSTRDVSPEPPPGDVASAEAPPETPAGAAAPGANGVPGATPNAPRILLPEATRAPAPKLFLAKPSPIKSDPIKPMQAVKIGRPQPQRRRESPVVMEGGDSPYSPGSSDFGDLFEPPLGRRDAFDALFERPARARRSHKRHNSAKVPVRLDTKKGKTQVDVKIDEDNLKILDDLPSSAVEMQVKSKFLKKLNRQERVVEEVKLVLKPHYNKKHVTKDEYKDILRRAVPKICHNKSGEINPSKIQALVEAYVKKYRKKHKLGLA